ncbi:PIN-like domain-containing protein [Streptomyces althioticus]|uniref:PIN-like domain-containing protein n=1 Tax=Streptomyces TaxID=1883 RepID=UPI0033C6A4AF
MTSDRLSCILKRSVNRYRYTEQARADLLAALGTLGDRLWIPHQVLVEFWRNRETTISEARSTSAKAAQEMSGHSVQAVQTLRTWGQPGRFER